MHKKYTILCLGILVFLFSSCEEYHQDIYINKDGSGKYVITYDIGEMMKMMETTMGKIEEEMKDGLTDDVSPEEYGEEGISIEEEIEENPALDSIEMEELSRMFDQGMEEATFEEEPIVETEGNPLAKVLGEFMDRMEPKAGEKLDTTFNLYSIVPDSLRHLVENPDYAKRVTFKIKFDEPAKEAEIGLSLDFDQFSQINDIFKVVKKMFQEKDDPSKNQQLETIHNQDLDAEIDLKKGLIKVAAVPFNNGIEGEDMNFDEMTEEDMKMMEMFFAGTISTTFHLPSKVKSCSYANAKIDGNKVTVSEKLLDMMKNKQSMAYEIKIEPVK